MAERNRRSIFGAWCFVLSVCWLCTGMAVFGSAGQAAGAGATKTLAFSPQPTTPVLQNAAWPQFAVRVLKPDGTLDSKNSKTKINLSLASGATGVLSGTLTKTVAAGVATFTGLSYNQAGTVSLKATASDIARYSMLSNPVTVLPPYAVSQVAPAEGAGNVATTSAISATFNRNVLASSINAGTFSVTPSVAGSYTVSGSTATFTPTSPLAYNTTYTVTLTQGVTDSSGNPLVAAKIWSFTTALAPLASLQFNPQPATPVLQNAAWPQFAVRALRSDGTVDSGNNTTQVTVSLGTVSTGVLSGTLTRTVAGGVATFTGISYNQTGTILLKAAAPDLPGHDAFSSAVTVLPPFAVSSVDPVNGAINVSTNRIVTVVFNRNVNPATVNAGTFYLTPSVPGTYGVSGSTATFTPISPLVNNTPFTITVTQGVTDTNGIPLVSVKTSTFRTINNPAGMRFSPQPASPVLINSPWSSFAVQVLKSDGTVDTSDNTSFIQISLTSGATGVLSNTPFVTRVTAGVANFARPSDPPISYNQAGTITLTAWTAAIPNSTLKSNSVTVFAPFTVSSVTPAANAVNVSSTSNIVCYFNRTVNTSTVTSSSFFTNPYVPGTFSFSGNVATFTPSSPLFYNTAYTVTVTQGVTDTSGLPLSAPYIWSFTTTTPPDWGSPTAISTGTMNNNVSYAGDTYGNGLAAWQKSGIYLYFNRLSSGQWGGEQLLARATTYIYPPQVAVGPDPTLAVWPDGNGPVSMFASEFQEPGGWSQTQNLGLAQTYPPPAIAAGNYQATAGWIYNNIVYASRWDAASSSLGTGTAISNTTLGLQTLRVCQDSNGQSAVAVWTVYNAGTNSLVANRFADNAWGTPTVIASSVAMTSSATGGIVCDGSGNTTVAFHSPSTTTNLVPYTIRYEATAPLYPTANWMPGWQAPVEIGPPIGSSWSESNISLAADASGAVIAVWPAINGSVQGGALLTNRYDPATGWGVPASASVIHTANAMHRNLALAVDKATSNGRAAAVWVDVATYRMYASIFDPLIGTWGPAETVSDPGGVYAQPQVSVDRNGTIRAVWVQNNSILSSVRP